MTFTARSKKSPQKITIFRHWIDYYAAPFTCVVAGCTQSGKTVWVTKLLENAKITISPPPEAIMSGVMDNGNPCTWR